MWWESRTPASSLAWSVVVRIGMDKGNRKYLQEIALVQKQHYIHVREQLIRNKGFPE